MRTHVRLDHADAAQAARTLPGVWTFAGVYSIRASAANAVKRVSRALRMPSYAPAGAYEAYAAGHEDGTALWVRYLVGVTDPEPRPRSMTYRVINRGTSRSYEGLHIETVTVAAECPRCGGPRGAAIRHRFCEDGEWYVCDRWTNPCDNVDEYHAVLAEHSARQQAIRDAEIRTAYRIRNFEARELDRDARPVRDVALPRIAASSDPVGFEAAMVRSAAALGRGKDLATAAWTAVDPVRTAAEIETLAARRRLALLSPRKDAK
ncbi:MULTISPECIES: hypothetical protein [unclassified Streptomyces]|uniref:hypothetical protein n=1 Tax=unclassified Streptomyces TaxID=2593676 RepID=UPI00093DA7C6|nr:hypothetical protein [Streptomyces sp. TSRI0281]OKI34954.1 hypothetical protein A6A29_16130 [Streptomyces sp. TSRI0281]